MRRALPVTVLTGAALATAACGAQRQPPPDTTRPLPPNGTVRMRLPGDGVAFAGPRAWARASGAAPQIAALSSGRASVTLWRYPRSEPLPRTPAGLRQAQSDLAAAAAARTPGFVPDTSRVTRVDGHPALDLRGTAVVAGQQRAIRSVHVYAFGAEVVVDALAEPAQAARVDRQVVAPLVRSLRVRRPGGGA